MRQQSVHVKRGDTVFVSMGKDKGVQARVLRVFPQKAMLLVEGVNIVKKAIRPTQENPKGGFDEREAPIPAGRVKLVCPSCGKTTRIAHRFLEGKKLRYCKKCDTTIGDSV